MERCLVAEKMKRWSRERGVELNEYLLCGDGRGCEEWKERKELEVATEQ